MANGPIVSQSSGVLASADFDYIFTETELQDLLGLMEKKEDYDMQQVVFSSQAPGRQPVPLQFQPHHTDGPLMPLMPGPGPGPYSPGHPPTITSPPYMLQQEPQQDMGYLLQGNGHISPTSSPLIQPANPSTFYPDRMANLSLDGWDKGGGGQAPGPQQQQLPQVPVPAPQVPAAAPGPAPQPQIVQRSSARQQQQQQNPSPPRATGKPAGKQLTGVAHGLMNAGSGGGRNSRESKPHVSHSTVEKQRRDRINSLIDELRDLVPPQTAESAAADNTDNKRPKHVVLSDAIALIKDLQNKVTLSDSQLGPATFFEVEEDGAISHDAQELIKRDYPPLGLKQEHSNSPGRAPPELPHSPEGKPVMTGVVVEQGEDCLYVKVSCKDRRGLLGDILMALRELPLEVTTAAVTTAQGGNVYDVFQVKIDAGSDINAQDIQMHVHGSMYKVAQPAGEKRRRN